MKIVGIDVGSNQVKVIEIAVQTRGYQILQYHSLQIKTKGHQTDVDLEVIEFLRQLTSKFDLATTKFVLGVRQDKVAVRLRKFPFTEKNKITKALPLELEDELPFPIETSALDFKIVRFQGSEAEVLACATPRVNIEKLINFFKDAGGELEILCPEGIAFANLFEQFDQPVPVEPPAPDLGDTPPPLRQVDVYLQLGHSRSLVAAIEKGRLVGVRSLLWGGKNITDALAIKYQLPFADAQRELELKGFILNSKQQASFEAKVFSDTISQSVREMVRDLQLSLLEIKSELNCEIQSLQTTGGVSAIQGLNGYLTQMLELPVNRLKLWDRFTNVLFERNDKVESQFSIALGLALEGLKKPRNPALNFLKGDVSHRPSGIKNFWMDWGLSFKWGAATLVALMVWASLRADVAQKLEAASLDVLKAQATNVAKLSKRNANEKNVKKYISEKRKVSQEMKSLSQVMRAHSAFDVLLRLSEMAPGPQQIKLDVRRFHVQDQRVWVEGFVRSPKEKALLEQTLKTLSNDGKVTPRTPSIRGPVDRTLFAYSFNVERGLGRE